MKTPSTIKTKSVSKSTSNSAVSTPQASKSVNTVDNSLPYDLVTSWRLKRSKQKPNIEYQKVGTVMPTDTFRDLQLLGIKYGVTQDEIILGLIDRELADVNGGSTLSHFIPVLNL